MTNSMDDTNLLQNNKLGITDYLELAREEERLSKLWAIELWDKQILDTFEIGTFAGLSAIHGYLFQDVYNFAGQVRNSNIAKGNFPFAPVRYLAMTLEDVSRMPQKSYEEIIKKYVEMNVAHPFREGNGRATRIWLDAILRQELQVVVDWARVDKKAYLSAMERSPVNDLEIRTLLQGALTKDIHDRTVFMKGLDASYFYEGYTAYPVETLV